MRVYKADMDFFISKIQKGVDKWEYNTTKNIDLDKTERGKRMSKTNKNNSNSNSGIGILGLLQVAFIIMKVAKITDWSWWLVFVPTYIGLGIWAIVLMIIVLIAIWSKKK